MLACRVQPAHLRSPFMAWTPRSLSQFFRNQPYWRIRIKENYRQNSEFFYNTAQAGNCGWLSAKRATPYIHLQNASPSKLDHPSFSKKTDGFYNGSCGRAFGSESWESQLLWRRILNKDHQPHISWSRLGEKSHLNQSVGTPADLYKMGLRKYAGRNFRWKNNCKMPRAKIMLAFPFSQL